MNEQRNPYRRDTEGAPISEGEIASSQRVSEDSLPAHAVVADGESADARTAPSASYSPPRVHASGQPVVRNETPLLITVFTIGIAAIAVVLFFVSQALGNLSTVEWSLPKPPTSEPERGAPNPNATQGMGEGTYEVPTDAWLHPGYKAGVTEWTASGSYVGVSQDKSTIVLDKLSNGTEFVGYDVKTGTEKWRKSFKGAADLSCLDVWNGIAYCSSNYDATKAIFASIDLATGELTQPGNIDKEGFRSHFIGHWQGYSYWTLEFDSRSSQVGPWQPDGLIAIKDQMLQ
ncbi:MAG: hypothetical protein Q4C87_01440 [Actinomycetaceae bacterium]|nr:hypothetical protein [Actinomycetaceae bacterium]